MSAIDWPPRSRRSGGRYAMNGVRSWRTHATRRDATHRVHARACVMWNGFASRWESAARSLALLRSAAADTKLLRPWSALSFSRTATRSDGEMASSSVWDQVHDQDDDGTVHLTGLERLWKCRVIDKYYVNWNEIEAHWMEAWRWIWGYEDELYLALGFVDTSCVPSDFNIWSIVNINNCCFVIDCA